MHRLAYYASVKPTYPIPTYPTPTYPTPTYLPYSGLPCCTPVGLPYTDLPTLHGPALSLMARPMGLAYTHKRPLPCVTAPTSPPTLCTAPPALAVDRLPYTYPTTRPPRREAGSCPAKPGRPTLQLPRAGEDESPFFLGSAR